MGHMEKRVVPAIAAMAAAAVMILSPANANAQQAAAPQAQTETTGSKVGNFFRKAIKQADAAIQQGTTGAQAAVDGVNGAHAAVNSNTVRGRMVQQNGSTVTCFNGIEACYIGPANMSNPGQATGTPLMVISRDGRALPNNADRLAEAGVIVLPPAAGGGNTGTGRPDTGYRDGLGCTDPSWTSDEIVRRRREIMECQSDQITERAYQRDLARRQQRDAAAGTATTPSTAANPTAVDPRIAQIQNQAAAGFAAILQQANAKPK